MASPTKSPKELMAEIASLTAKLREYESMQPLMQDEKPGSIPIRYLASMLDNAQEAIIVLQDEVHKYVNQRTAELAGCSVEELIGRNIRETTHPDDYPLSLQNYKRKLRGEAIKKYRYRGIDDKGDVKWLEIIGTAILWEGRPAVLNFVTDMTMQVMAEENLKKSEKMLWDIINFLPDPTFAIDTEGRIISWNREMEKMVDVKADHMLAKSNFEYALPFYGRRIPMLIDLIRHPDEISEKRYPYFKREDRFLYAEKNFRLHGEVRWLWCKASLIYDHNDQIIGAIESMRDVTDIRKAEADLKDQSIRLEEANTALKVLLKHQQNDRNEIEEAVINNVKTLISPFLDKLKVSGLEARQEAYVHILESHVREIASPFLSKMSAQHANLTPREIQIASLVKEGKSTKEIAQTLNIALHTVNNYRKRLRKKFSLQSKDANLRAHLLTFK